MEKEEETDERKYITFGETEPLSTYLMAFAAGDFVRIEDDGPGIANIERALEDGFSTGRGLGLGLPGARRLMDRVIVESAPGQGTGVEMWKWIPPND